MDLVIVIFIALLLTIPIILIIGAWKFSKKILKTMDNIDSIKKNLKKKQ